ncbi:MAG: hypothetical protein PVI39_09980 [Desulfobacteraceae bacterium]|jgi:hypothetical protein
MKTKRYAKHRCLLAVLAMVFVAGPVLAGTGAEIQRDAEIALQKL